MVGGLKWPISRGGSYLSSTEIFTPGTDSGWSTVSPLPRTVYTAGSVSLNNRIFLFGDYFSNLRDCSLIFVFTGNLDCVGGCGVTSDADTVYEWKGDEEEWRVHGTILDRRSHIEVSLVPLSSGVLDHCTK